MAECSTGSMHFSSQLRCFTSSFGTSNETSGTPGTALVKRIAILGSTGSIGTSALDVARTHADRVEVVAIAAATNVAAMVKQIIEFRPRAVAMATAEAMDKLTAVLGGSPAEISGVGNEGLCEIASHPDVDIVLCA